MTPLEHLRVWLRQREGLVGSVVALQSDLDEARAVVTIGDLRTIEALASAHDGERAAKNLDDFGALTAKAARLERENEALLEDLRHAKAACVAASREVDEARNQIRRADAELTKERARADAFFSALEMMAGVKR